MLFIIRLFEALYVGYDKKSKYRDNNDRGESIHIGLNSLLSHRINEQRKGLEVRGADEVGDNKVVKRKGKGHNKTGENTGHNVGQLYLKDGVWECFDYHTVFKFNQIAL